MGDEVWTPERYHAWYATGVDPGAATLAPVGTPEKRFQARVLQAAKEHGWLCYHTHDSRRSQPGFPDLVLVRPGALLFAELKSATGKLTQEQVQWLSLLQSVPGVEAVVWRPGDWQTVQLRLDREI
jgi:hypothetical protein